MHSTSILSLALALCGAVLAIPAAPMKTGVAKLQVPDPDCAALQEYCKCKNDDFQCETDVDCEWCRAHHAWDSPTSTNSTAPASTAPPVATHTSRVRRIY
ncbi:hypothetical protein F5Y04DRAFT_284822 [Hypomontagnella monticulosa]|nr:hypothetical protein F5Y04DRAFT_284822 [Hypomontagnella monticulosa]